MCVMANTLQPLSYSLIRPWVLIWTRVSALGLGIFSLAQLLFLWPQSFVAAGKSSFCL